VRRSVESFLVAVLACVAFVVVPSPSAGSDLAAFLGRAEKMAAHNRPVRADIRMRHNSDAAEEAVLIIDPAAGRQLFAVRSSGWRALLPLAWADGKAAKSRTAEPSSHGIDEPIAGTDVRGMEFFPFWKTDYATAFISDDSRLEKTVTLYAPDEVPYVLFVITFDKSKLVPHSLKYYRDSMSNLVRLRTDSDHVMVGSRPRPRRIVIDDFTENSRTTLDLAWQVLESVPEGLTDEERFNEAAIDWPAPAVAAR
jgi:hypothetical protein